MAQSSSQTDPVSVSSEEEPQRSNQITSRTLTQQELGQKKQQQEQEDAEFKKQLDEKDLKQLMQLQREQQEEAERKAAALDAVKRGDMAALSPYKKGDDFDTVAVDKQDSQRNNAIIANEHLRNEKFVSPIEEGIDPAQKVERAKKWLKETFPTLKTEVTLVKDKDGKDYIATLGVSLDEAVAAQGLQNDKRRAQERSAEVTAHIQEKIKEGPQKTAAISEQTATALATPSVQRESPGLAPAQRG
jgi:hypothetical protein